MSEEKAWFERLREGYDESDLYLVVGVASAIAAWLVIPLLGLVAAYCGYRLYENYDRTKVGGALVIIGGSAVVLWLVFLTMMA